MADNSELRKRAEAVIAGRDGGSPGRNPSDTVESVVHDLQVYQIELELQNEELREAYLRLEETTREYRDLFERAPMGLVVVDGYGMIRRCNSTFLQLVSSEEQIRNRPLADLVTPESARVWRARFRAFFSAPEEKRIDLELIPRQGGRRILRLVGRTMNARLADDGADAKDGELLMLVGFDVTGEIAARERTESLLEEKDLLLRELRHRTQNHLVTIHSMLSFQASYAENELVEAALTGAQDRIEAMLLVNEILTSRGDQKAVDLDLYLQDLTERIREVHRESSRVVVETDLESIRVVPDTAYTLGMVYNELLTNVFKYAFPTGEDGTAYVSLRREPPDRAALVVVDTGVGFRDGDTWQTTEPGRATSGGIGLPLVRGLLDRLGGTLTIESTGDGTRSRVGFSVVPRTPGQPIPGEVRG